jgi:alpha-mannosidase
MTPYKLHLIGNAHIDPAWLWLRAEGYQEARATFHSALDRMEEFPQFIFTASQASLYRWIEEVEPDLFVRIQAQVKAGRWAIVGGWWVEPDCNIPAGESFARQALYSQRYFKEKFGEICRIGYCTDSFGHTGMLPQLLRQGGMDAYVFMRPNSVENPDCPTGPFWWQSADGTRILTYRIIDSYGTSGEKLDAKNVAHPSEHTGAAPQMYYYGVGDHGGGPTIANISSLEKLQEAQKAGQNQLPELEFSSPIHYFQDLRAQNLDLPTYFGELQHHSPGCYAAHSGVKLWNRRAENALLAAERWELLASVLLGGQGLSNFEPAWQEVLFHQFHDVMAGTCIVEAYDEVRDTLGGVLETARAASLRAQHKIAAHVATRLPGVDVSSGAPEAALIVFNPHPYPLRIPVEVEAVTGPFAPEGMELIDASGQPVEYQKGKVSAEIGWGWRDRLAFTADLPAMGYHAYGMRKSTGAAQSAAGQSAFRCEMIPPRISEYYPSEAVGRLDWNIETPFFEAVVDGQTGCLKQLKDKRLGADLLSGKAEAVIHDDKGDTWAHGILDFHDRAGRFGEARVEVIEQGALRLVVRTTTVFGKSRLVQDYVFWKEHDWIEVRGILDWQEHNRMFKLAVPVRADLWKLTVETAAGCAPVAADGKEFPGQRWLDLTGSLSNGQTGGVSLVNDRFYSFSAVPAEQGVSLEMTVLRSPVYAHHVPYQLEIGKEYQFMDQGRHEFRYWIYPHAGDWQSSAVRQMADVLNMPPAASAEGAHPGTLPGQLSVMRVEPQDVDLMAWKPAEGNSADWIVRVRETVGKPVTARVSVGDQTHFEIGIQSWEIKTLRISNGECREVNFLEE